jgi:hypothetical protein
MVAANLTADNGRMGGIGAAAGLGDNRPASLVNGVYNNSVGGSGSMEVVQGNYVVQGDAATLLAQHTAQQCMYTENPGEGPASAEPNRSESPRNSYVGFGNAADVPAVGAGASGGASVQNSQNTYVGFGNASDVPATRPTEQMAAGYVVFGDAGPNAAVAGATQVMNLETNAETNFGDPSGSSTHFYPEQSGGLQSFVQGN